MRSELAARESDRTALEGRIAELQAALDETEGSGDALGEVEARDHLIAELRERLDELEGVSDRLVAKEAEAAELEAQVEAAVSTREAEVTRLQQRLAAAERAATVADERDSRIRQLEEELDRTQAALDESAEAARRWEAEAARLSQLLPVSPAAATPPAVSSPAPDTPTEVPVTDAAAGESVEAQIARAEERMATQFEERIAEATARLESRIAHQRSVLEDKEARIAYLSGRVAALEQAPPPPRHPDDLKAIKGIGPALERLLNDLDILTYEDIATLAGERLEAVRRILGIYPDRIEDDEWIPQARALAARR